jgi:hypothetical protein
MKGRAITANQVKKIHTLKSLLDVSDETYRQMLSNYKVTTSKDLSFDQADGLIQIYEHFAIKDGLWSREGYRDKYETLCGRIGMATPSQLRMVEGIWTELYPEPDEKRRDTALRHYLFRFFKVSDLRFLDGETVNKVLYALKQMQAREKQPATKLVGRIVDPETGRDTRKTGND